MTTILSKTCPRCNHDKPLDEFALDRRKKTGRSSFCKLCAAANSSAYYRNNRDAILKKQADPEWLAKRRAKRRQAEFGISDEQLAEMLARQGGVCAICGGVNSDRELAIDHNHKTGAVRALLCTNCNTSLGGFQDDPVLIAKALAYLKEWNG